MSAAALLRVVLVAGVASVPDAGEAVAAGSHANVSVQVVSPDAQTVIRARLDGKVIFDQAPARSSFSNIPTIPVELGPFALAPGSKHVLIAEVPGGNTRGQLEWTPQLDGSAWVVIRYYPGRPDSAIPPFFTFALQAHPHKLR